jgi:two-component system response regulator MprA
MTADRPRILVIEDERHIATFLRRGLTLQGYDVHLAADGVSGLLAARTAAFDLVLLDRMLPDMDGVEVCRQVRSLRTMPIIMVTARDTITDRVIGLDAGADDYVVKPFHFDELLARVRAALRRETAWRQEPVSAGPLEIRPKARTATVHGQPLSLTPREFELLEYLARRQGEAVPKEELGARIWGGDVATDSHVLPVYIRYLRRKLAAAGLPQVIRLVRGVGYALDVLSD